MKQFNFTLLFLLVFFCTVSWGEPAATMINDPVLGGLEVDVRLFADLSTAMASPKTVGKTIVVSTVQTCNNLTWPTDRGVRIVKGGRIDPAAGKVLHMNGVQPQAGLYQIYGGGGTVTGLKEAPPEWFGTNTNPGFTDMTAALDKVAVAVGTNGSIKLSNIYLRNSAWDVSNRKVYGNGPGTVIKATSAQFNLIMTKGNTTLEGFTVDGGWDGITAGQKGDGIHVESDSVFTGQVHIERMTVINSKRTGIYFTNVGYSNITATRVITCGLHGIWLNGVVAGSKIVTTVNIDGMTTASSCPNGYGLYIEEAQQINVFGMVIEDTHGIKLAGTTFNKNINLNGIYQENYGVINTKFLTIVGGGTNLVVQGCRGPAYTVDVSGSVQWDGVFIGNSFSAPYVSGSSIFAEYPTKTLFAWADFTANNATPYGTIASITLTPGTWLITAWWDGVAQRGAGRAAANQTFVLGLTAAFPSFPPRGAQFTYAKQSGTRASTVNTFDGMLPSSLSLRIDTNVNRPVYLYGGFDSITGTLSGVIKGTIFAQKVI